MEIVALSPNHKITKYCFPWKKKRTLICVFLFFYEKSIPGWAVAVHAFNTCTQEAEAGGLL